MHTTQIALMAGSIVVLFALPLTVKNDYVLTVLFLIFLYSTLANAWNISGGYTYQLNFGISAAFGLGAYITGYLLIRGVNLVFAIFVSGACAVLLGLTVAPLLRRLRAFYFALATTALALIVEQLFLNWSFLIKVFGGSTGFPLPYSPSLFSMVPLYYAAAIIATASFLLSYWLSHSNVRYVLAAIRSDEVAAQRIGIDPFRYKVFTLVLTSFLVGIAGGVYAYYSPFLDPSSVFDLVDWGIIPIFMVFIGGVGSLYGPIIGVVFFELLQQILASNGPFLGVSLGIGIIMVVLLMPGGIVLGAKKLIQLINR